MFREVCIFLAPALFSTCLAFGVGSAQAQDGVVVTPTSINRIAAADTTVWVEDGDDTAAYGEYLATLVTIRRPPEVGEPCRVDYPAPSPIGLSSYFGRLCLVE